VEYSHPNGSRCGARSANGIQLPNWLTASRNQVIASHVKLLDCLPRLTGVKLVMWGTRWIDLKDTPSYLL
jgi:hypothetical protein